MIAACYIRVSTEEQVDNFSLAAQVKALQEYCDKNKINIYKIYTDEGISGQKENRPAFQQMLKDAEKGLFNIILVHKFDRFARKIELSHRIKSQLKKNNVNLMSITEPIENSPIGFFQEGLLELLAEYYVKNLAQESKKGHVERASQGLHNGSVPFGYKIDKLTGDMVINEEQTKIVKWIFEMYNNGYGSTKIAMVLNSHNIPTASGGEWAHFTVNRILKNVKYISKIYYDGMIYDGKHEAIISEDEFYLANKNMKSRTNEWSGYRGKNYDKFLLLGLAKCGICGYSVCVHKSSTGKRLNSTHGYVCNQALKYLGKCKNTRHYNTAKIEKLVLDLIKKDMSGVNLNLDIARKTGFADILINRKDKISSELERAKKAYLSGVFTLEEFSTIKQKLEAELQTIKENDTKDCSDKHSQQLKDKISGLWERIEKADSVVEKRNLLSEFVDKVVFFENEIIVKYYI